MKKILLTSCVLGLLSANAMETETKVEEKAGGERIEQVVKESKMHYQEDDTMRLIQMLNEKAYEITTRRADLTAKLWALRSEVGPRAEADMQKLQQGLDNTEKEMKILLDVHRTLLTDYIDTLKNEREQEGKGLEESKLKGMGMFGEKEPKPEEMGMFGEGAVPKLNELGDGEDGPLGIEDLEKKEEKKLEEDLKGVEEQALEGESFLGGESEVANEKKDKEAEETKKKKEEKKEKKGKKKKRDNDELNTSDEG